MKLMIPIIYLFRKLKIGYFLNKKKKKKFYQRSVSKILVEGISRLIILQKRQFAKVDILFFYITQKKVVFFIYIKKSELEKEFFFKKKNLYIYFFLMTCLSIINYQDGRFYRVP